MKRSLVCLWIFCITFLVCAGCVSTPPHEENVDTKSIPLKIVTERYQPALSPELSNVIINSTINTSSPYWITIDPISDHTIGDKFTVRGTTNLNKSERLYITVSESWFRDVRHRYQCGGEGNLRAMAFINTYPRKNGINLWNFSIDTAGFPTETYDVEIYGELHDVSVQASFNLTGNSSRIFTNRSCIR